MNRLAYIFEWLPAVCACFFLFSPFASLSHSLWRYWFYIKIGASILLPRWLWSRPHQIKMKISLYGFTSASNLRLIIKACYAVLPEVHFGTRFCFTKMHDHARRVGMKKKLLLWTEDIIRRYLYNESIINNRKWKWNGDDEDGGFRRFGSGWLKISLG